MEKVKPGWLRQKGAGHSHAAHEHEAHTPKEKKEKGGRKSKWAEYIALATVPMVMVLGNSMLVPILPDLERQLGVSSFQSSLVITLFSVTAGVFIPVAGYLSDRLSRKAIIIPSLIVYGVAGIVAGLGAVWNSYTILIAARAVQGLGAAGTAPIAMALVGDMYKNGNESEALGLIEAANGTGKVISPILGSLFALIVWFAPFFAFPAFCALSLLAMMFLIKEPKHKDKPPTLHNYLHNIAQTFRKKGKWLIPAFIAGSLALFVLFGVLFFLSDLLEKPPYGIDGVAKGGILAIPLFGLVVTSYVTGRIIKNKGHLMRVLMNVGLLLMSASLTAAIWGLQNLYLLLGLLTLSSIGTGLLLPCINTLVTGSVDKAHRGMITSLYSSLRFLGVAFGPPIFGWLVEISKQVLFTTVAILAAAALAFVFFMVKPPKVAGDTA
ncbi:MFS transporter [Paenibacillus tarimensis]|uniref:MFS transporter n=1 Tax=Paenibacillus tarimensis TaxID=416012 RepID=UPI00228688AE|nr:MFS transporter [Paenibacillus tarimensis]